MLYFAIPGATVDGARFIPDVIRQDAAVIVTEKAEKKLSDILQDDITVNGLFEELESERVTIINVPSARYAMGIISSRFYGEPSKELTVIGITGTKGKTTTSYMIKDMLELAGVRVGLIGTIEIQDGTESLQIYPLII